MPPAQKKRYRKENYIQRHKRCQKKHIYGQLLKAENNTDKKSVYRKKIVKIDNTKASS